MKFFTFAIVVAACAFGVVSSHRRSSSSSSEEEHKQEGRVFGETFNVFFNRFAEDEANTGKLIVSTISGIDLFLNSLDGSSDKLYGKLKDLRNNLDDYVNLKIIVGPRKEYCELSKCDLMTKKINSLDETVGGLKARAASMRILLDVLDDTIYEVKNTNGLTGVPEILAPALLRSLQTLSTPLTFKHDYYAAATVTLSEIKFGIAEVYDRKCVRCSSKSRLRRFTYHGRRRHH